MSSSNKVWLRPLAALYLTGAMFLIGTAPPVSAQINEDPMIRCFNTHQRAKRMCYLTLENQLIGIGGAAALACLAGLTTGGALAVIICLVALGVSLLVAINLMEQYELCVEGAEDSYEVCVEVTCT